MVDYVKRPWESEIGEQGSEVKYYRLKPGTQPKGKIGSGKEEPQNPPTLPDAINAARKALEAEACKNLFSKGNGLAKLNELVNKNRIKVEDTKVPKELVATGRLKDAPGIGELEKGGKIYINPSSPVMKGTYQYDKPNLAFSGLKPEEALASLIIHGLRHVTKDIEPDAASPSQSILNNLDVANACFPKSSP